MTRFIIDSDGRHIPEGTKEFEQIVGEWASDKSLDRARRAWRTRAEFQLQAKLEARKERDEWKARAEKAEAYIGSLHDDLAQLRARAERAEAESRVFFDEHAKVCRERDEALAQAEKAEAALRDCNRDCYHRSMTDAVTDIVGVDPLGVRGLDEMVSTLKARAEKAEVVLRAVEERIEACPWHPVTERGVCVDCLDNAICRAWLGKEGAR